MPIDTENRIWKAAAYLRTSKGVQEDKSNTLENQEDMIRRYLAHRPDIELRCVKADNGYTGTNMNRPAVQELLRALWSKKIDCVIVKDLSRFSRNYIEAGRLLLQTFPQLGVRVISLGDHYDSLHSRPVDTELLIPVRTIFNQAYSMDLSQKICRQLEIKRESGEYIGAFPVYGYKKSLSDRHQLVVDEPAAEVVRQIFQWRLEGLSNDGIANRLNQMGIPTPSVYKESMGLAYRTGLRKAGVTPKWFASSVIRILSNRVYTGTLQQGKSKSHPLYPELTKRLPEHEWAVKEHAHEAIISEECFETVSRLALRDTKARAGGKTPYLLAGLIYCADCGESLRRRTANGYSYYCCMTSMSNKNACGIHRIRVEAMEAAVQKAIRDHIDEIKQLRSVAEGPDYQKKLAARVRLLHNAVGKLRDQIQNKRRLLDTLEIRRLEGMVSHEDAEEFRPIFQREMNALETGEKNLIRQIHELASGKAPDIGWMDVFFRYADLPEFSREAVVMMVRVIFLHAGKQVDVRFVHEKEFRFLKRLLT